MKRRRGHRRRHPGETRIFISYRRDDTAGHAGRLYDALTDRFGPGSVFMDFDIPLGEDFRDVIGREVESCYALLAVIGRNWLTVTDEKGRRRLDDPDDFLRLEIQSALEADFRVRVIPVLVQGTGMPRPGELPDPLVRLSYRQAHILSDGRFHADVRELIERLGRPRRDRFASLQELRQLARPWALIKNALWRPAWLNVAVTFGLIIAGIFTSRWLFLVAAAAYLTLVTVTFFSLSEARRVHELARRQPRGGSARRPILREL